MKNLKPSLDPEFAPPEELPKALTDKLFLLKQRKNTLQTIGKNGENATPGLFCLLGITKQEYQSAVLQAHSELTHLARERVKNLISEIKEDLEKL